MITGNKGEWSEIYAFLKILGDKVLFPGNAKIERIPNFFYPVVKILRSESTGDFEYSVNDKIIFISGGEKDIEIPVIEFKRKAITLLKSIKQSTSGTFAISEIEEFMQKINCISLKAHSSTKTDITIIIHDQRTNQKPALGFSIKSQLGRPSTLLNAGKTTNFIFRIENLKLNKEDISEINNINTRSKIRDRIQQILDKGGTFKFVKTDKQMFANNLVLIDSLLPELLSHLVFEFFTTSNTTIIDLLTILEEKNPLKFDNSHNHKFYIYKIKRFLTDVALGMMPSKVWTGKYDATGGYLIVKEDGNILCYHIYNRNDFEDYLINNTKLETPSSSRHSFGQIYAEKDELFFKLNLQIRFIK